MYVMFGQSHQWFQYSGKFFGCVICHSANTGNYGPEWNARFMDFWQPIKNIQKQTKEKKTNNNNITNRSSITVPYNQGLSESFKNIGKKYGIQVHFKSGRTIKDELVAPNDRDHITKKSGIIYRFKCDRLECDEEYIGETSRTFGERFREHPKAPSLIHDHSNTSGHTTTLDNFKVVGREEQSLSRLIKESMYIRVNGPSLNKNIGKYHLPHMWDEVLNNSRELKLK